jgi:hypothetical protein
MAGSR